MARIQQFACKSCGSHGGLRITNPRRLDLIYCEFCKAVAVYDPEDIRITTTHEAAELLARVADRRAFLANEHRLLQAGIANGENLLAKYQPRSHTDRPLNRCRKCACGINHGEVLCITCEQRWEATRITITHKADDSEGMGGGCLLILLVVGLFFVMLVILVDS